MGTSSNQSSRILTRGEESEFKVSFFADQNQTTPLVPIDPSFPSYTIYDPAGIAIQSGVATMVSPGQYRMSFLVPKDAALSYFAQAPQQYNDQGQGSVQTDDQGRYRMEWQMVTNANQQVNFVEEFDVRDVAVTQSLNRELQHLVLAGDPLRLPFRSTTLPYKVRMRFIIRGHEENPVYSASLDQSLPQALQGDLKYVKDGDSYVLYCDIDEGVTLRNTCYMALWTIQESQFSVATTEWQIITSISTSLLPLMTHLRMLVDKFQKRLGRLQSYEDSDLLEYLAEGLRLVNLSYPTTGYRMDNTPDDLQSLVLLAAGWYALKAQGLLEADLAFNFSGQSVTLSVDRAGALDAAASSMMDMFNQKIGPAKMAYYRRANGVGTVSGRAYSYRNMYNYTYKVSGGSAANNNLLTVLTKIGLL